MADYKLPIISGAAPSANDVLRWNGNDWVCYDMTASINTQIDSAISDINTMVDSAISDVDATIDSAATSIVGHFDSAIASIETVLSGATSDARSLASAGGGGGGVTESHMDSAIASIETVLSDATETVQSGVDSVEIIASDALSVATANGFVDRGDPDAWDKDDFTADANFYDWDLSAIVPAGAIAVLLHIKIEDASAESRVIFRKNGNVNTHSAVHLVTQVANVVYNVQVIVPCDSNRIIEYYANEVFTTFTAVVIGWWIKV